jgi:elongation factor P
LATTNDIKNGTIINLEGKLWQIVEFQHVKPGKGGAFVRTKMKNIMTGKVVEKTFNAGIKIDTTTVDRADMQYLYEDGQGYVFMDNNTYDQITLNPDVVGSAKDYLLDGMTATIATHDDEPLFVELPASVVLTVTFTEPGLQGDRSSGGTKPAKLETGLEVQVPLFINEGDKIKVDTRAGTYIARITE